MQVSKKSDSENDAPQLAIEDTQPQPPIENNEAIVYDTASENTLENMKISSGFFKTYEDPEHGWVWNGHPIKILGGSEIQIKNKKYNITPSIQHVLVK